MIKTYILLLSVLSSILVSTQYIGKNANGLDIYKIDLNRDPQERFKEVVIKYEVKAKEAMAFYTNYVPRPIWWVLEKLLDLISIPSLPEYYQEVEGMAKYMNINVNLLLVIQFVYDLSSFCTSIVVAEPVTGNVIHLRNLDFANPAMMRNITYEGWFYRDEKLLFRSTMFAGMNGVMTGERPNAFSISLNSRNPSYRHNYFTLMQNIGTFFFYKAPQVTRVIRETLEECDSYEGCAYPKLTTTPMMAYSYLTIAGSNPYEGAIISRDRYESANIR
jgi:N-acylethanolamine-hydrolysing acid amidase